MDREPGGLVLRVAVRHTEVALHTGTHTWGGLALLPPHTVVCDPCVVRVSSSGPSLPICPQGRSDSLPCHPQGDKDPPTTLPTGAGPG